MTWKTVLSIIGIIVGLILFVGLLYYLFTNTLSGKLNELEKAQSQISQLQSVNCPPPKTVVGAVGPVGPPGKSGGIFQKQGPLRNLANPTVVMDRLAGLGPASVPYLSDMNYSTHQTWTLDSNNDNLKNEYGGCLYADNANNLVYISDCNTSSPQGLQWFYDNFGRLKLKSNMNKCLTPKYQGTVSDVENKQNLNFNNSSLNKNGKFMQIKLDDCNQTNEQKWAFY
jgi:hypothetical protein